LILLFITVLLAACATGLKYDTSAIDLGITPQQAVVESEALQGKNSGKVGECKYIYPLVKTDAHYLWAQQNDTPETSICFVSA